LANPLEFSCDFISMGLVEFPDASSPDYPVWLSQLGSQGKIIPPSGAYAAPPDGFLEGIIRSSQSAPVIMEPLDYNPDDPFELSGSLGGRDSFLQFEAVDPSTLFRFSNDFSNGDILGETIAQDPYLAYIFQSAQNIAPEEIDSHRTTNTSEFAEDATSSEDSLGSIENDSSNGDILDKTLAEDLYLTYIFQSAQNVAPSKGSLLSTEEIDSHRTTNTSEFAEDAPSSEESLGSIEDDESDVATCYGVRGKNKRIEATRHITRTYQCVSCGLSLERRIDYIKHMKMNHREQKKFPCWQEGCDIETNSVDRIVKHYFQMHIADGLQPRCNICKKPFNESSAIERHMPMHFPQEQQALRESIPKTESPTSYGVKCVLVRIQDSIEYYDRDPSATMILYTRSRLKRKRGRTYK